MDYRLLDPSVSAPQFLSFYFVPFAPDPEDNPEFRIKGVDLRSVPSKLQYPYLAWFDLSKPLRPQLDHYEEALQEELAIAEGRLIYTSQRNGETKKSYLESLVDQANTVILKKPIDESIIRPSGKRNTNPVGISGLSSFDSLMR